MQKIKKIVMFVLVGLIVMEPSITVKAEELDTNTYCVPYEKATEAVLDLKDVDLQDGEKIVIGDYTIEYQTEDICLNSYARATTKNHVRTP